MKNVKALLIMLSVFVMTNAAALFAQAEGAGNGELTQEELAAESAGGLGALLGGPAATLLPMILIFVVFYFLLIRPQQQQQKKLEEKIKSLNKGDRVVISGIYGEYQGDKENGKIAIVKISEENKIEVVKAMIQGVIPKGEKATGDEVDGQK